MVSVGMVVVVAIRENVCSFLIFSKHKTFYNSTSCLWTSRALTPLTHGHNTAPNSEMRSLCFPNSHISIVSIILSAPPSFHRVFYFQAQLNSPTSNAIRYMLTLMGLYVVCTNIWRYLEGASGWLAGDCITRDANWTLSRNIRIKCGLTVGGCRRRRRDWSLRRRHRHRA